MSKEQRTLHPVVLLAGGIGAYLLYNRMRKPGEYTPPVSVAPHPVIEVVTIAVAPATPVAISPINLQEGQQAVIRVTVRNKALTAGSFALDGELVLTGTDTPISVMDSRLYVSATDQTQVAARAAFDLGAGQAIEVDLWTAPAMWADDVPGYTGSLDVKLNTYLLDGDQLIPKQSRRLDDIITLGQAGPAEFEVLRIDLEAI